MTQPQVQLKSQPQGLSLLLPPFCFSHPATLFPAYSLNLSVTTPWLGLFCCQSSSRSLSTHLSVADSISVNHSALSALLPTASIDLHLLPEFPRSLLFSIIFLKFHLVSAASLHFIRLIISHHFTLSATVPHTHSSSIKKLKTQLLSLPGS